MPHARLRYVRFDGGGGLSVRRSRAAEVLRRGRERESRYGPLHDPDSWVCWASVTKIFVAALCAALVERGEISWATRVEDLAGREVTTPITIDALVEHRSSLPRMLPHGRSVVDPYREWTTERFDAEVLGSLRALRVNTSGAAGFVYSNLGYAVLTRSIEIGLGSSWIDLMRKQVLEPLGIPPSSMKIGAPVRHARPGLASTMRSRDFRGRALDDWDVASGPFSGAGGLCSTVSTMVDALARSLEAQAHLAPSATPHAWSGSGTRFEHAGALLRSGSLVVVDTATGSVAAAHAVGGVPGHGDRYARRALVRTARTSRVVPTAGRRR